VVTIISHAVSDIGLKRSNNEDAWAMDASLGYWTVADGMGGAAAGEVASRIFVETTHEVFSSRKADMRPFDLVQEVFRSANARIISEVTAHPQYDGMGCTAELVAFGDEEYFLCHVGDSRTYIYRNGQLRQLTRDHSLVQHQLDRGLITEDEARKHPSRSTILRAVGVNESLSVDCIRGKVLDGDVFLLCSDGLTDMVDDTIIRDTLALDCDLQGIADQLVRLAKSRGGKDNITVVLCQVVVS
jgi:PPM family protein phosphatase